VGVGWGPGFCGDSMGWVWRPFVVIVWAGCGLVVLGFVVGVGWVYGL